MKDLLHLQVAVKGTATLSRGGYTYEGGDIMDVELSDYTILEIKEYGEKTDTDLTTLLELEDYLSERLWELADYGSYVTIEEDDKYGVDYGLIDVVLDLLVIKVDKDYLVEEEF